MADVADPKASFPAAPADTPGESRVPGDNVPLPDLPSIAPAEIERYGLWIKRTALHLTARMPWADVDELVQWGVLGLLEARQRFDPSRGRPFEAYAGRRIRGAMLDSLRRDGNLTRRMSETASMGSDRSYGHSAEYEDPLAWLLQSMEDGEREARIAAVSAAIEALPERPRLVLQLFFVENLNNREIAQVLEASEASVSRTRKRALQAVAARVRRPEHQDQGVMS